MSDPVVDLSKFKRATSGLVAGSYGRYSLGLEVHTIAQLGYGLDPRTVPVSALQLMTTLPPVYMAIRTISGIIRRADLFSVKHGNPKIVAEVEAWLWRLLPRLLGGAARGFIYGSVVVILDWERATLRIMVPKEGAAPRAKTLVDHTHFSAAYEIHPDETTFNLDPAGEIVSVNTLGGTYSKDRAVAWIWDSEFGDVQGQGALRRAWRSYCEWLIVSLLRDKFLERSVDAPRVAFAPDGKVTVGGVEWEIPAYVGHLLDELRGSGSLTLPSVRDGGGNLKYDVKLLDVNAAAADVFDKALDRCEASIFLACLVAPTLGGGLEEASGGAGRTLDGMLREHIEDLANFAAQGLTDLVQTVHRANYDPAKVDPPEIVATDVGKQAARKIYQEVLRLANSASRGEISMRTDIPRLLDKLGIPLRDAPMDPFAEPSPGAGPDPGSSPPGRPSDPMGQRQDRRDDAATDQGEHDTGGETVDGEPREGGQ